MDIQKPQYFGDGVYAVFNGFSIELRANHHETPTDRIFLEPEIMDKLIRYYEEIKAKR